jgi:hypothetical protein
MNSKELYTNVVEEHLEDSVLTIDDVITVQHDDGTTEEIKVEIKSDLSHISTEKIAYFMRAMLMRYHTGIKLHDTSGRPVAPTKPRTFLDKLLNR